MLEYHQVAPGRVSVDMTGAHLAGRAGSGGVLGVRRGLGGTMRRLWLVTGIVVLTGGLLTAGWQLEPLWVKPPEPPSVGLLDIRVRVFSGEPAEVPLDFQGKLHVFCNKPRGHLIYVYDRSLVVLKDGCR